MARLDSAARFEERQRYVRERFVEALGGFPERTPLRARITRTLERDDYRMEMLVYESLPGFRVTANVYVPRRHEPPYPAVLGVAGHSDNSKASATYQRAWISMAKRGFLALAYDPPGQAERSLYFDPELGRSRVLNLIPGRVVHFQRENTTAAPRLKIPHMGWNAVSLRKKIPVFDTIEDRSYFYFVHSYHVVPEDTAVIATTTNYGIDFVSSIEKDNIFACQFHPEKSQQVGLRMLKNFGRCC